MTLPDPSSDAIRVLHVDDDPDFADLTATYLEREEGRIDVRTATGADEAEASLRERGFDCVVSDYDMPGRTGIDLLESVRERSPDLPFILYTGKGSEEIASEAISAGVTDYLQKESGTDQYAVLANRITNAVEHHRSQRMVERSQRRLREIIDALPYFLYVVDEGGRYLLANEALADFHGATVDDIEGAHVTDVLDEPAAEHFLGNLEDTLEADTTSRFPEIEVVDSGGEARVFDPELHPYEFGDAGVRSVLGVAVDVTERRERERELERVRERMEMALDQTESVIFDVDFGTGAVTRHGAYEQFFGHPPEEIPTWEDHSDRVVHPDDRDEFRRFHRELMDGSRERGEIEYRTGPETGDVRWIRAHVHAAGPSNGRMLGVSRDVTERKERERELERATTVLSTLFETLPVGVIAESGARNVVAANERLFDLFGVPGSPDEAVGADCERMAAEVSGLFADPDGFVERIHALVAEREPVDGEELALADGRTFERTYRPIDLPDGDGHLWVYRDVTDQKERERELREERAFVDQALDALQDSFFVFSDEGEPLRWNDQIPAVTGYTDGEIADMGPTDFFVAEHRGRIADAVQEILETGDARVRADVLAKDGRRVPYDITGTRLVDANGEVMGFAGIGRDVTGRRERERELERARDLLEQAERIADVGGWEIDAEAMEVFWTDHLFDILGREGGEEPPLDEALDVYHEDDRPVVEGAVERALEVGEPFDVEARFRRPDGEVRWLRVYGSPTVEGGEVVSLRGAVQDITERKSYERDLERQNARLSEFASVVSHDLRNPLNVAEARLELAREGRDSEHLDAIERAHGRMEALIDDLLTLAREGERPTDVTAVDLPALAESCWRNVDTGDATLRIEADGPVRADERRLRQLFENLFRNAVEHGGGGVTVTVGGLDGGFYVADDGVGIPDGERERVFEAGYSTAAGGTGFGLRIVEQVADAHGWEVAAAESEGGGARFEVTGVETPAG